MSEERDMDWVSWVIVVLLAVNGALSVLAIGKRRQPITAGQAAWTVLVNAAVIVAIVLNRGVC
jgi:hypothetical protein